MNVKVDREERPDLDALYMDAVVALTGHGGWPMTVFLTPGGRAVLRRHLLPARAAPRAAELPRRSSRRSPRRTASGRDDVARTAERARRGDPARRGGAAVDRPADRVDPRRGRARACAALRPGLGRLRRRAEVPARLGARAPAAPRRARHGHARRSTRMAAGGMYDLVGGGFHRYSVDERWLVPHFEKMLYDNALLVPAYLHGWLVTGRERYREIVEETVEYMLRELRAARGRVRLVAGRGHGRRRGAHVHVDRGRGRPGGRAAARAVRARPLDRPRRAVAGDAGAAARDPRRAAAAGARRQGDRVLERARARGAGRGGPAARPRRLARRGPRGSPSSCSGRSPRTDVCTAATAPAARAARATSTTTRTSRTGSTSCTSRPASCAGSRSRGGWRCSRSSCSPTTSAAASS